jgi:transcriptional regulator with XRE-family HTH domain
MPRRSMLSLPPLNIGSIGDRLAFIRKSIGLTQIELAKKIGITQGLVSEYENDKLRLYDKMLARFAIALNASIDEIVGLLPPKQEKVHYSITRRINRLKNLSQKDQKHILRLIDIFISAAERKGIEETPQTDISKRIKTDMPDITEKKHRQKSSHKRKSRFKQRNEWCKEEIEILEIFYPQSPEDIILNLLNMKTWNECIQKAKELGIGRKEQVKKKQRKRKKDKIRYTISIKKLKKLLDETELTIIEIAKRLKTTPDIVRRNIFKHNL